MQTAPPPKKSTAYPANHTSGKRSVLRGIKRSPEAFTLVEVVLAIGIIAFAFVPLVGLLPIGLDVSRQAIQTTVQAQIAQQLTTEVQQTDFSLLGEMAKNSPTHPYYFDDQGNNATDPANRIYQATLNIVSKDSDGNPQTMLPDGVLTKKLATVTICILNLTGMQTNKADVPLTDNPDAKKYVVLIPDNGR